MIITKPCARCGTRHFNDADLAACLLQVQVSAPRVASPRAPEPVTLPSLLDARFDATGRYLPLGPEPVTTGAEAADALDSLTRSQREAERIVRSLRLQCDAHQRDHATLMQEIAALRVQCDELTAIKAGRARIRASFGHRDDDGTCGCPYCRGSADDLAEHAADYELQLHEAQQAIVRLTAIQDGARIAWQEERARVDAVLAHQEQEIASLRAQLDEAREGERTPSATR